MSLPLVVGGAMRSPFDLVSTVPEAKNGTNLALGGGQGGAFAATFDGVSVNTNRQGNTTETSYLTPSLEAITEFAVDTNGFKAEYGQAGGGVISFASKSGTNELHGSAYDFIRNDYVDARGFFAPTKGVYRQNDFGGSLGGPVWIPKLYNGRNRTFFFVAYEGFRNRQGSPGQISSVPTPEMYQGDFSNWVNSKNQLIPIYDTGTTRPNPNGSGSIRDPFPGNIIPVAASSARSRTSTSRLRNRCSCPIARASCRAPSAMSARTISRAAAARRNRTTKFSVKIDHAISSSHHLSYLFNRGSDLVQPGASGSGGPAGAVQRLLAIELRRGPAPRDLRLDDFAAHVQPLFARASTPSTRTAFSVNVGKNWKSKVCIINAVDCNVNLGNVSFSEFSSWGGAADNGTEQPRWALKDDFSYIRGSHTLKFGATYDHQEANGFGQQNIAGQATFSFLETAVPGDTSATSGSSFASFLLGYGDTGATETVRYLQAGLPLLRLLRAGRLAHQPQADAELRPALRIHAAAGFGRRPVFRLLADHAESGGEQLSRRADLRRARDRDGRASAA